MSLLALFHGTVFDGAVCARAVAPPLPRLALHLVLLASAASVGCEAAPVLPPPDAGSGADAGDAGASACARACDDGVFCNGVEVCDEGVCRGGPVPCATGMTCSEADDACVSDCATMPDADGDGEDATACGGLDCDDDDPTRHPGATEVCDGDDLDEDCDPSTFGTRDSDGDGYVDDACCNGAACGDDCVDAIPTIHPDEAETCNGIDDDCDGRTDETVLVTYVVDGDRDGHGDATTGAASVMACDPPAGYARAADDCDDAVGSIHPGAYDRCDTTLVDDDCSGAANDPPGGCGCTNGASRGCPLPGACGASTQACIDGAWTECAVRPIAEICGNLVDDDCDGAADDGCACTVPTRFCGSDVGTCTRGLQICASDDGSWGPCLDAVQPAPETCNDLDDDCDGATDEGVEVRCFADTDRDGYSVLSAAVTELCAASCPAGTTDRDPTDPALRDCDPADARVFPGQTDSFTTPRPGGSFDYDCDGASTPAFPVISSCIADARGNCIVPAGSTSRIGYDVARGCGQSVTFLVCATIISSGGNSCDEVYRCASGAACPENRVECR